MLGAGVIAVCVCTYVHLYTICNSQLCASVHDLQLTAMEGLGREVMLNGTVMLLLGTFTFSR